MIEADIIRASPNGSRAEKRGSSCAEHQIDTAFLKSRTRRDGLTRSLKSSARKRKGGMADQVTALPRATLPSPFERLRKEEGKIYLPKNGTAETDACDMRIPWGDKCGVWATDRRTDGWGEFPTELS